MAFWKKKTIKGLVYYYIYESYYQDGKSKQRMLEYIGTIDDVLKMAMSTYKSQRSNGQASPVENGADTPDLNADEINVRSYSHGDCMALWYGAKILGIQKILDECFPAKTIKGLPLSEVLILVMIQRALDPGSKRQFANWVSTTSLPYYLGFQAKEFDSQALWEAMDGIRGDMIREAWNQIVQKMQDILHIDSKKYHLDYTNFFTFNHSLNNRCVSCKRGHNKQKRDDLLRSRLDVLTASALQIPTAYELYDGNKNDKSEFSDFVQLIDDTLTARGQDVSDITIMFDGGSNSAANFTGVRFHIVCPDSLISHKELYDISVDDYEEIRLSNGGRRLACRVEKVDFCGVHGTGVFTCSEDLKQGQIAEMEKELGKLQSAVDEMNERLGNPRSGNFTQMKKRETQVARDARDAREYNDPLRKEAEEMESAGKELRGKSKKPRDVPVWDYDAQLFQIAKQDVLSRKYLNEFVEIKLTNTNGVYKAEAHVDALKKEAYIRKYYGKKLLCTDHVEWSTLEILNSYRDQECIEELFYVSKDPDHFSIRPQFHWTDDKIKVHVFLCFAAITIAGMLRKKCEEQGFDITKDGLLGKLHLVCDAWICLKGRKVVRRLEEIEDDETARLWEYISNICNPVKPNEQCE